MNYFLGEVSIMRYPSRRFSILTVARRKSYAHKSIDRLGVISRLKLHAVSGKNDHRNHTKRQKEIVSSIHFLRFPVVPIS